MQATNVFMASANHAVTSHSSSIKIVQWLNPFNAETTFV